MTVLPIGVGGAPGHVHWSGGIVVKGRGHVVALSNFLHHCHCNLIVLFCISRFITLKGYITVKCELITELHLLNRFSYRQLSKI